MTPTGKASWLASVLLGASALAACVGEESTSSEDDLGEAASAQGNPVQRGRQLFRNETFDGNDRTCSTCHRGDNGTISPKEVERIYDRDSDDPLFRALDSDEGDGESYERLIADASIRIILQLPPNIRPLDDLDATEIELFRGVPTTNNIALEPVLMAEGREPTLQSQALSAIHDHAEPGQEPTSQNLDDIAAFERTKFSSSKLEQYANGGPPPRLPNGHTASEKRGRAFFEPDRFCGLCHSGPMLNETSEFSALGPGARFEEALAGELDFQPNPVREWAVIDPDTGEIEEVFDFPFPDPGRAMVTGNPDDVAFFKIPTLWGIKDTAPYFHDGSAKTLEDLMSHYQQVAEIFFDGEIFTDETLTARDQKDIINFLKLL